MPEMTQASSQEKEEVQPETGMKLNVTQEKEKRLTDIKSHATGVEHLDDLLSHLITLFERSFPARVRSYYLGGSYSDGTAVGRDPSPNSSDVDLFVIFRGRVTEREHATFERLVAECQRNLPLLLDAHAYSEHDLVDQPGTDATQTSFLNALIREASVLVYGEDLRADLPPVPFSQYVLDVIESGLFHLSIPRQREHLAYPLVTPLVFPLTYPDTTGELYGYNIVPTRPKSPGGTRVLVALTAWIATFILAVQTRHYTGQKSQSLRLCKVYLPHDERIHLATTINDLCKGTWGYTISDSREDRERLRGLCRETLSLENEYLRMVRTFLLAQLQHGTGQERRHALRILENVVYRDNGIMTALEQLTHDTDETVQTNAAKALEIQERNA